MRKGMVVKNKTTLEDIIGLNHTRLGYFSELQTRNMELTATNLELETKQRQIQAILNGITDVMAVVSLDFRVFSVNDEFERVFGAAPAEGAFCYAVFRNREEPCDDCPLVTAKLTNRLCRKHDIIQVNGKNRQFEITASPLRDLSGKPTKILLLKRDVTLEKEFQAKYYHAEKMATIGLLAAGVAHEINNPLTAISGFAEGLQRRLPKLSKILLAAEGAEELDADFKEYVETIREECDRCRKIVRNLLTFNPRRRVEFTPLDLNAVVIDVLKLLRHRLKQHPRDMVTTTLAHDLPPAHGIDAELKQVVLNLVLNALDAVGDKGSVTIETEILDTNHITLSVRDTGEGIPVKYQDKLFEPFFTTKPAGKGIGIGLSTCYNIIRQHHGEILVNSLVDKGSTFTVKLPFFKDQEP